MSSLLTDADGEGDGDEASRERHLRYRVLLAEYRTALALAFVVLLVLGGWLSYGAYADPGEQRERRLESEWTATGAVTHSSVVTEPNEIHPEGTRLEEEPLYYESIAPTVDAEFTGGYDAARADDVTVELRVDLVYRAVDSDDGTVYWSRRESLESISESDVAPDETVTAAVAVNVTDVRNSISEIETDLEASPGETEIFLEFERTVDGTIAGDERSTNDSYEVPIRTDGNTYRLDANDSYDETREEYATETVAASPGPFRSFGGPALLVLGLVGLGGVGIATYRWSAPTPDERAWLAFRDDRAEFDEVITTARLPASALEGPRAEIESLDTLARLGIDLESAVIFDPDRNRYVVRDDDLRYVFEPPRFPAEDDVLAPVGDAGESTATGQTTGEATTDALEPTETDTDPTAATAEVAESASVPFAEADDRVTDPERGDETTDAAAAAASPTKTAVEPETRPTVETEDRSGVDRSGSPIDPTLESQAASDSEADTDLDLDPGPTAADRSSDIDEDDLLALAGLEPADISEPELFDLEAGREGNSESVPDSDDVAGVESSTGSGTADEVEDAGVSEDKRP